MNPEETREPRFDVLQEHRLLLKASKDQEGFVDLLRQYNSTTIVLHPLMDFNWGIGVLENVLLSPEFNITTLILSHSSGLTAEHIGMISRILIAPDCKVKNLDLSACNLSKESVAIIANTLQNKYCKIEILNLDQNNIDDESAQYILDALRADDCKIKDLSFTCANMTAGMMKDIIQAGTISKKVKKFDFAGNIVLTKNDLKECFDAANATLNRATEVWLPIDRLNYQDKREVVAYADRKANYQDRAQKAVLTLYAASRDRQKYSKAEIRKLPDQLLNQVSEMIGARPKISIIKPLIY